MKTPFIIADVGSNWRRFTDPGANKGCALLHIREAARCGVDAVKFQLFTHQELYGRPGDDTYALPEEWLSCLARKCEEHKVEFMCTAFSAEGVKKVDPYVKRHKVASAEMLHWGIWDAALKTGKPIIASTGGAEADEVRAVWRLVLDTIGMADAEDTTFLECVASYPAAATDYNLFTLRTMYSMGLNTGVSDHTLSSVVALVAIGLGATVFEKHFSASAIGDWDGPDLPHSLGPVDMLNYVSQIREGFACLGDGIKRARESETDFVKYAKRPSGMNTFRPGRQ